MNFSVVIPTYNRPECIARSLATLAKQVPAPLDVVIVDASTDDRTRQAVEAFRKGPLAGSFELTYITNPAGRGNTANSRNIGVKASRGEISAFLDDDSFPHDGWAMAMLETYQQMPDVAGVAGRALNGQPGEAQAGVNEIGKFRRNGTLTGNFAADPGRIVEVDHAIGCNMSLRRSTLDRLGGFVDDINPGPFCLCEETEIFLRAGKLGMKFVFNPKMTSDHIAAPQPGGRRFSPKYSYFHSRNNLLMILRIHGWRSMAVRHVARVTYNSLSTALRKLVGAISHLGAVVAGLIAGAWLGVVARRFPTKELP